MLAGIDPDFHRRDLADAIEAGAFPQWELGVQVFPDTPDADLRGHRPARPDQARARGARAGAADRAADADRQPDQLLRRDRAGRLPRRPPGARASTSPTTRCCRPGCSPTSTPSSPGSAGRTSRQIPINRPHAPVNDMLRDGFHQQAVHGGVAPYRPNSLDGGCPFLAGGASDGAFVDVPGRRSRRRARSASAPASFDDHFSQARLFWLSMTPGRAGAHRRAPTPSSSPSASSRRSRSASCWRWPTSTRSCARRSPTGLGLPAPEADRGRWSTSDAQPGAVAGRPDLARPTAGRSGSSSTPTAT